MEMKENREKMAALVRMLRRDINGAVVERMEQLGTEMARTEGVTEELKAADPMKWVGLMNSLRNAAEETVLAELIYN